MGADHAFIIRELSLDAELNTSAQVIHEAFATVTRDFGITENNCPTHPAFVNPEALVQLRDKGATFFGAFRNAKQVGFVALEKLSTDKYELMRLAVVPGCRHMGCGRQLMDFACGWIRQLGARTVCIGIIDENCVLKEWYRAYGFYETEVKQFDRLPFRVCLMEKQLNPKSPIPNPK